MVDGWVGGWVGSLGWLTYGHVVLWSCCAVGVWLVGWLVGVVGVVDSYGTLYVYSVITYSRMSCALSLV